MDYWDCRKRKPHCQDYRQTSNHRSCTPSSYSERKPHTWGSFLILEEIVLSLFLFFWFCFCLFHFFKKQKQKIDLFPLSSYSLKNCVKKKREETHCVCKSGGLRSFGGSEFNPLAFFAFFFPLPFFLLHELKMLLSRGSF